ncbi:hypothetical protein BDF20DRAFT_910577 [Mycotypha africana]|uniref:uncharacterized protein n=1 Tax=Mycotypha africana TaxID=64632 RepID=UPI00230067C8|nr:uncharacterized protein BDF20DRAFT_910577 [Mycotypha africana]KAI8988030.1 hypothetical protein BDF20DRAFT_910577 [Mycotypha africana]
MNVIINQYKQCLVDISGAVKDDVKLYIASLLEDVGNKSFEEQSGLTLSNCSNVNIATVNYGTQVVGNHSNKKRKIFEESASPLSSTSLASSPLQTSPADLAPTEKTFAYFYDEFESEEEIEIVVEEDVKLEKLNVVQIGRNIGSELTRKYYPKNLIDKTEMITKEIPDSFVKDQDFYNRIFDTITLAKEQSSNELLAEVYFSVFKSNEPFMKFFHVVVHHCDVSGMFIEDSDIYKLETCYNYRIIWPIIDHLSKSIETTRFQPGEVRLQAVCDELKLVHKGSSSYYNADGVIINDKHSIEIAIVETTGPFHLSNNPKETHDYIKAGYGLISMLHYIGRKFSYGDFDIFKRIGVFFVQKMIIETYEAIDALESSHIINMKIKTRKAPGYEDISEIQNNFKKNTIIKLPNVYIQKTSRLNMNSSPNRPDN